MTPEETGKRATDVLHEVERVVVGKHDPLTLILVTVLAGGHVLIEDLPGLGKTLIAKSFAQALGLEFTRIQFTPDLLPADITGSAVYDQATGELNFRRGPLFTNLLLADEVNRTPPKTQAALLEAMAEGQVSADGHTHRLPEPFVVLATAPPSGEPTPGFRLRSSQANLRRFQRLRVQRTRDKHIRQVRHRAESLPVQSHLPMPIELHAPPRSGVKFDNTSC